MAYDQKIERLEKYEITRQKLKLPQNFKPCIVRMMNTPLVRDENSFQRSKVALIIAAELIWLGRDEEKIEKTLTRWNNKNIPPLKPSDIRGAISCKCQVLFPVLR